MTGARARALFLIGFGIATAGAVADSPAHAQVKSEKAASDQRARELFQKGDVAYAEGRYEEALGAFQEAYDLSGRAQLLFNVSNALERLGRYQEAVDALDKYLASGKAKDRDVVQKRLANLKKRVEEQKKEQDKLAKDEEEKRKKEEEERAKREAAGGGGANGGSANAGGQGGPGPTEPDKAQAPMLPWILIGGGGVVFATGAVFGILTLGARSEASDGCTDTQAGHLCTQDAGSAIDREKTFGLVADIGMLSGLVLAGVGTYFLLTNKPAEPHVKVGVRPGGVIVGGTF